MVELVLSSHHKGPQDQTQGIWLMTFRGFFKLNRGDEKFFKGFEIEKLKNLIRLKNTNLASVVQSVYV